MSTGKVVPIRIEEEMKKSYIDYAMSVIVGRALPDVRDGLKPVHRRILYAMYESGLTPDKPFKKSATVVGNVMARYHPHGDAAIYDTMVRLAQDFSTRYLLVDGHGNFGSVDGDSPAAMRYTEAKLSSLAMEMLRDINKQTVDFIPNYDESWEEPVVLPSRVPNLLINGSSGIAVGMATNIPPHNISEVIDAIVAMIEDPEISIRELMKYIKGPDFPTGGIIMGNDGIKKAYETGRGTIKLRAKAMIEKNDSGKPTIIVNEIPYQVNKARLIEKIADLVRNKKIDNITDLRDESDRNGMRIVIELKREANAQIVLNQLYSHTQMQESFGIIQLALVEGKPQIITLRQMMEYYLEHQKQVVIRRTQFDLNKARARAHIVEGLRIALQNLDEVIKTIRNSRDPGAAKDQLMQRFNFSEKQAQAILDMRLQRLTGLEREKLEEEYVQLIKDINYFEEILANERLVFQVIKEEIQRIKERFADARRTQISFQEDVLDIEDLIPEQDMVITITHRGYVKRLPTDTYRSQKRGGRGILAMASREKDFVSQLITATTHHYLLFFSNKGKVYRLKVHEIPEVSRTGRGVALTNLFYLDPDEQITAVIPLKEFAEEVYLLMGTRQGIVKKTPISAYDSSRRDGLIALNLDEGDELIGVKLVTEKQEAILGTKKGLAIRFPTAQARSIGRATRGVKGIDLAEGDAVVGIEIADTQSYVLVVSDRGFGKITPVTEYRSQSRAGKGILTFKQTGSNGEVVGIMVVNSSEEFMLITSVGNLVRIRVEDVSRQGRSTQGVKLVRLAAGDRVVALGRVDG